jgi:hypothetical protein
MKTNDPLDDLLQTWNPPPRIDDDLRIQVWHRIAATAGDADGTNTVVQPIRTRVAAIAAVAVLVAGFGLGILTGNGSISSARDAYFSRIDPIARAR